MIEFLFRTRSVTPALQSVANNTTDYLQILHKLNPSFLLSRLTPFTNRAYVLKHLVPAFIAIANGARIGEVLALKWYQVQSNGLAFISGEKGGRARQIWLGFNPPRFEGNLAGCETQFVFEMTYQQVYKYCRMVGLGVMKEGHMNKAVTHQGRYAVAAAAQKALGTKQASEILGHRSVSSTMHYTGEIDTHAETLKARRSRELKKLSQKQNKVG